MTLKNLLIAYVSVLAAAALVATIPAAPDRRPPRIVTAAMQDVDGDARADHVRITYSERIRHAADRDGAFPFTVGGYTIRSVAPASPAALVLTLAEQDGGDASAQPLIAYRRTPTGSVSDAGGNQAVPQRLRAAHVDGPAREAVAG
jgi:hypothetical protein